MRTMHFALGLALGFFSLVASAPRAAPPDEYLRNELTPYAQLLADSRDRPRRVVYTPYPVSATKGLVRGFVHVTDGSAVLARADLVVDASLPIVLRRAYSSTRSMSRDFGSAGWMLTVAERIDRRAGGKLVYTYGNGATLSFDRSGVIETALDAYLTDVAAISVTESVVEVRMRGGLL